jgi:hypothetical protein
MFEIEHLVNIAIPVTSSQQLNSLHKAYFEFFNILAFMKSTQNSRDTLMCF